jgi:hypothetical protein
MTLVVGTDEAGYGPNLGPLVVAATAWRVAAEPAAAAAALGRAVAAAAAAATAADGVRGPLWADSKSLHKPGGDGLARGVATALLLLETARARGGGGVAASPPATAPPAVSPPADVAALADMIGGILPQGGCRGMWHALGRTAAFPADASAAAGPVAAAVAAALAAEGVALEAIACRAIYPDEFNAALDAGSNKSDILSEVTLDLAAGLVAAGGDGGAEPAVVWCDRHGGRKRYGGLVARHFAAPLVHDVEETARRSAYELPRAGDGARPSCRIEFTVGGEERGPVAVASMVAKHVRELAMRAFNEFWSGRVPGLRPTAGYPTDAIRWRTEAAGAIDRAGIAATELWRRA